MPDVPSWRVAIAKDKEVRIAKLSAKGLVPLRTVKLPAVVADLQWKGDEPVVVISPMRPRDSTPFSESHPYSTEFGDDGVIGKITDKGFEEYPRPPDSVWAPLRARPKDPYRPDVRYLSTSSWQLHAAEDGGVWLGHCMWETDSRTAEAWGCTGWGYVRLDKPAPFTESPPSSGKYVPAPTIKPATSIELARVPSPDNKWAYLLQCKTFPGVRTYPPSDHVLDQGMGEITWYANDPPIYSSMEGHSGYVTTGPIIVFEGCEVAKSLENPELEVGPNGLTALYTENRFVIIDRGRVVVSNGPGASVIRFAPR